MMLRLTNDQLARVWAAARPLPHTERATFLEMAASALRAQHRTVYRAIRAAAQAMSVERRGWLDAG